MELRGGFGAALRGAGASDGIYGQIWVLEHQKGFRVKFGVSWGVLEHQKGLKIKLGLC